LQNNLSCEITVNCTLTALDPNNNNPNNNNHHNDNNNNDGNDENYNNTIGVDGFVV